MEPKEKNSKEKNDDFFTEEFFEIDENEVNYGLKEEELEQIEQELFAQLDEDEE
jgi:hypothetical protein